MVSYYLIELTEQAEQLADELFAIAVVSFEYPQYANFNKTCKVLERAMLRAERRKRKAGI